MKKLCCFRFLRWPASVLSLAIIAFALDGDIGIHDPSTVVLCDGKYLHLRHRRFVLGLR